MTNQDRKERRVRMGTVEVGHFEPEQREWTNLDDLVDIFRQELQGEIDAIVQHSKFTPVRLLLHWEDNDDSDCYPGGARIIVYGYRLETDKEWAVQRRRRQKKQQAAAQAQRQKEAEERALLTKLKAKYEPDPA